MNEFEEIESKILRDKYKYISFDIFDTVLVRPFWNPSDLFYLLDVEFEKFVKSEISFHTIRVDGESGARLENRKMYPDFQDVTIDEIYCYIEKMFSIPAELCQHMKQFEIELELKFLAVRESVKRLYEYALACDKKIIFVSDMYMNEEFIQAALKKNGYTKFEKLFISSKERVLKKTGDMYKRVLEDLEISASEILHIGDNAKCDIEMAEKEGIETCYIPRTIERFKEACGVKESDYKIRVPLLACSTVADYRQVENSLGYRCMLAIIANRYFDNPFRRFLPETDFNEDPFFIGYYAVGMHLLGLNRWIEEKTLNKSYRYIWFTSRDGWLLMHAYNIFRKVHTNLPEAKYLYLSRESTLPAQIIHKLDFYSLPIEYWRYSPETLLDLLSFCCKQIERENVIDILEKKNIIYVNRFKNVAEYHNFINVFLDEFYSEEKHKEANNIIYMYFSQITENDLIFDMGYSGRVYCAVSALLKKNLDVLFVYSDAVKCQSMCRKGSFRVQTLYDYSPSIPGFLREFFLSADQPSCVGYDLKNNHEVIPVFSNDESESDNTILEIIHKGAMEFVDKFYSIFGSYLNYIFFKATEVSFPFEGMLENVSEPDRLIFEKSYSEDKIYGRNPNMNIARFWRNKLSEKIGDFIVKDVNREDSK